VIAMRIKITKSSDARALCNYALEPSKQKNKDTNPVIATNMAGCDEFTLAQEFELIINRPRHWPVERTMAHYYIILPPREELKPKTIADISKELLHQLGHAHCPYFVVQHHDQEHKRGVHHWHIVTSTITYDGRWVDDSFNTLKLKPIEREIENRFGLTPSPTRPAAERQNLTTGEHRRKERTGEALPKEKLWIAIDSATQDRPTLPLMLARLKAQGIDVHLWRKGYSYSGISFALDGAAFAGRRLGPAYSLGGLQRHKGLYYDAETHNAAIEQILNESPAGCRQILDDHTTARQLSDSLAAPSL
ncbi:MAG: relaxase/mobilization nuclease domain-containing protein, partial [Cyanobacteria bacterium P01_D01_bin.128]